MTVWTFFFPTQYAYILAETKEYSTTRAFLFQPFPDTLDLSQYETLFQAHITSLFESHFSELFQKLTKKGPSPLRNASMFLSLFVFILFYSFFFSVEMVNAMYEFYGDPTGIAYVPIRVYHSELSKGKSLSRFFFIRIEKIIYNKTEKKDWPCNRRTISEQFISVEYEIRQRPAPCSWTLQIFIQNNWYQVYARVWEERDNVLMRFFLTARQRISVVTSRHFGVMTMRQK